MNYIVVAFYTENTPYAEEVQNLIASLKTFNLPMDIVGVPTQGNWDANTHYKAYFIKQMLIRHFPKNILYLDADARVQKYPILFDAADFDVGVVYNNDVEMVLIGSTLYFANNAKVFELVERWVKGCSLNPTAFDQEILQYLLEQKSHDLQLKVRHLPQTYCQIFDLMKHVGDPVIEQFQASRRYKHIVNSPVKKV